MADVKRILVVDDHFEMLEFLRSMLELSEQGVEVLGVPSAEEAYLELRRISFDLLITDVRLPGMSGFELVRRVKNIQSNLPIIMITAYSSSQGEREANELGVFRYFRKPLNTDALLASVKQVLYKGEEGISAPDVSNESQAGEVLLKVERTLTTLRTDTGASQVVLVNTNGEIISTSGQFRAVNVAELAGIVGKGLEANFEIAKALNEEEPFTIQYQRAGDVDLYMATVGWRHVVMILFEAKVRRGRIGTVWVFAQRIARTLAPLVVKVDSQKQADSRPAELAQEGNGVLSSTDLAELASTAVVNEPPVLGQVIESSVAPSDDMANETVEALPEFESLEPIDDDVWETLGNDPLLKLLDNEGSSNEIDLDAFWDEALTDNRKGGKQGELTFEEALKQGLISTDWESDSD